jgi:ABC-type glycerol-3-phosphate transport system substrate-binding protein
VKFVYPTVSTVVPANVGIVANPPNQAGARAFVDFILSDKGQELLLLPAISRLPVNPAIYAKAPEGYPNPFKGSVGLPGFQFDVGLSGARYAVVDTLFDQLITFNLEPLKAVTKAIHDVEARLARRDNPQARALIAEARALISRMPVTAAEAISDEITASFKGTTAQQKAPRQAELEQKWSTFAKENYAAAAAKVADAARLAP